MTEERLVPNLSKVRGTDETLELYHERLKGLKMLDRAYLKGRTLWNSGLKGTAVRARKKG